MTDNINTADLVKRLRAIDHENLEDCFLQSPYFSKAADRIEQLEAALTRANAATAAAYEVAARRVEREGHSLGDEIRALATPDQTAALDKLIAEAVGPYVEALIWCSGSPDFNDGGFARKGWLKLCAPLIDPSKKGGV